MSGPERWTKMKVFVSRKSGVVITRPLAQLVSRELISEKDGTDYIPAGYYITLDDSFFFGVAGKYAINLKDIIRKRNHTEPWRLNGCCGLDGCDGLNLLDENGNEIGTEKSDCWMPHCAILEPDKVRIQDLKNERHA